MEGKHVVTRFTNNQFSHFLDSIPYEMPLQIEFATQDSSKSKKKSWLTTMRTPGDDVSLVIGLLYSEGIINVIDEIQSIETNAQNQHNITVSFKKKLNAEDFAGDLRVYSSCGLCGKQEISDMVKNILHIPKQGLPKISSRTLTRISNSVLNHMEHYRRTGGMHACALFNMEGNILSTKEDIGRHNAMDKLIGQALSDGYWPLEDLGVFLSGRASFELVQKAAMAGIPIVASVGAPSNLSIELADIYGLTLIGFLKEDSFNIYTHQNRVSEMLENLD